MDYFDIINKAFRLILPELVNYIGNILKEKDEKNWWRIYVLQKLSESTTRNLPKNGTYEELINNLDILACLNIIIENWHEIFKYKLKCKFSYIHELKEIRHDTLGHTNIQISKSINEEYVNRALDTIYLLMNKINKNISENICLLKNNEININDKKKENKNEKKKVEKYELSENKLPKGRLPEFGKKYLEDKLNFSGYKDIKSFKIGRKKNYFFTCKNSKGKDFEIYLITHNNIDAPYLGKEYFDIEKDNLFFIYIIYNNNNPKMFCIPAKNWKEQPNDIFIFRQYDKPGQISNPEYGINSLKETLKNYSINEIKFE